MRLVEGYADVEDLDAFLESLTAIGEEHGCVVQAFDARYVASRGHLDHALRTARRAIDRGEAIARDPAVEVLCYAAGTRQIEVALKLGVAEGRTPVVVLVARLDDDIDADGVSGSEGDVRAAETAAADAVRDLIEPADLKRGAELGDPERLRSFFGIDEAELAASDADLATLVRERVALLAVER
ncbi:KEOPS complex Cgi121-like subunit [Salinarchaeum sp. Harcht-Bsk1]|uniref:KEOPS complex subunit Cgi121 n=1 Tax=Salinarchaeum sp. Harcht-Bsk1 TaxID=1333523 RepID=UPI000342418E|nr:KEOPS complex subunit Cgi121 [Salinarchaeum sp. Harcht-Bsk1]AGN01633.1 KEOPS complex Cgi121-like subunit [Salinarchaeum sp. Harcht-Bsk1]